jgi:hypothetical protein
MASSFPTQKVDEALQAAILDLRRAWRLSHEAGDVQSFAEYFRVD